MPDIPKGAKKPADRAAKAEATGGTVPVKHGKHTYAVDADAFDDVETFALIGRMQMADEDESVLFIPLVVERLLGPEQWKTYLRLNRDERGRVRAKSLGEIFDLLNEAAGNQ